jgi:hypothetical protein
MRRRELLLLLTGALTVARVLRAQQKAMPVIGFLNSEASSAFPPAVAAFRQGLSETGYVEGQNVAIEYRWAEGHYDRLPALAADLVGRNVDVIVTSGGIPPARAAKDATATIPIVFTAVGDPVAAGLVASLARPGGNLTGVDMFTLELMAKRLELLSELVPQGRAIALSREPEYSDYPGLHPKRAGSGARQGGAAPYPEGKHRKRNRRRFRYPHPIARRCARPRPRSVIQQPARADRGAGGTSVAPLANIESRSAELSASMT